MKQYVKLVLISSLVLMVSCTAQLKGEIPLDSRIQQLSDQAEELVAFEQYQKAAEIYQQLADKPSGQQQVFRLRAAKVFFKIGADEKAKAYADSVTPAELLVEQRNQLYLLYAQIHLNAGNAEQALNRLLLIQPYGLTREQKIEYHSARAFAFALTGQLTMSARERVVLDGFLSAVERQKNSIAILEVLALLPVRTLQEQLTGNRGDAYRGWVELALILRTYHQGSDEFELELVFWASKYPDHAGQELIASGYFVASMVDLAGVTEIAIFLPESGVYAVHAQAVKEGIMAAYYQHENDAQRPNLHFYDTQSKDIVALYHEATVAGAQLIIGPLNKKIISQLADNVELTVPVLALNAVDKLIKNNLYQFALSPIDEVQQIVNQAWFEGHKNAIILAPNTPDGERISSFFVDAWSELDGSVLTTEVFEVRDRDFSFPVKRLLNIHESKYRIRELSKVIYGLKSESYRRQDVDVVFLIAGTRLARLINPHFYHNRAESIRVYGLSRVYGGQPAPNKDIDLEGVNFCSIPWLFEQAYQGDLGMRALQDSWQQFPSRFFSLIAFGIDAYNLVPHLNKLDTIQYSGATGGLSLNVSNRIERRLVCAKFQQGEVKLIETAKSMAVGFEGIASEPNAEKESVLNDVDED